MTHNRLIVATLLVAISAGTAAGCSSAGPRKYVLFGDPQPEKVEMFEDFWKDYPFKPDDPSLPLRRGKGGVIRFFKKNSYTRSIMVDGDLTVNVYYSVKDGVTLTQPDEQMVLTSQELNEKHRKFDKETGYSYHVYLDLGEYDQPEKEITILSVFKDAKTGQATLSKEIRTTAMGSSPAVPEKEDKAESEAEALARKKLGLGDDVENPIAALQERYALRNKEKREAEDARGETRQRANIDLSDSKFSDLDEKSNVRSVSYLEEIERKRAEKMEELLELNREKQEYYRDKRRRETENYLEEREAKTDPVSSLRDSRGASGALNFSAQSSVGAMQKDITQNYEALSSRLGERALEEYEKGPKPTLRSEPPANLGLREYRDGQAQTGEGLRTAREALAGSPDAAGYQRVASDARIDPNRKPSEVDALDDFEVSPNAPPSEIYLQKSGTTY